MHDSEKKATFADRWSRLRQHMESLDGRAVLDSRKTVPKLKRMSDLYLAKQIQRHRQTCEGQGLEFHPRSLERWKDTASLPQRWHLEALNLVLREHRWSSRGLRELLYALADPNVPNEEWLKSLEACRPRLFAKWSDEEGRWELRARIIVARPNVAGAGIERERLVDEIMRATQCDCATMAFVLEGLDDAALELAFHRARSLP